MIQHDKTRQNMTLYFMTCLKMAVIDIFHNVKFINTLLANARSPTSQSIKNEAFISEKQITDGSRSLISGFRVYSECQTNLL